MYLGKRVRVCVYIYIYLRTYVPYLGVCIKSRCKRPITKQQHQIDKEVSQIQIHKRRKRKSRFHIPKEVPYERIEKKKHFSLRRLRSIPFIFSTAIQGRRTTATASFQSDSHRTLNSTGHWEWVLRRRHAWLTHSEHSLVCPHTTA